MLLRAFSRCSRGLLRQPERMAQWLLGRAASPGIQSLAVLPLPIFPRPNQDYFADGMTEAL